MAIATPQPDIPLRVFLRVLIPLIFFVLIAVPLESYIQAIKGLLTVNLNPIEQLSDSLFFRGSACFYCITVLVECIIIIPRLQIVTSTVRGSEILTLSMALSGLLLGAFVIITNNEQSHKLNHGAAVWFLSISIILSCVVSVYIHMIDHVSSIKKAQTSTKKPRQSSAKPLGAKS